MHYKLRMQINKVYEMVHEVAVSSSSLSLKEELCLWCEGDVWEMFKKVFFWELKKSCLNNLIENIKIMSETIVGN